MSGATILDEKEASFIIRPDGGVLVSQLRTPDTCHQEMGEELQIRYMEVVEMDWRAHRNELIELVMICADAGSLSPPSGRTGVQGDVDRGLVDEEGDPVPESQSVEPPAEVVPESFFQVDMFKFVEILTSSSSSFCSQYAIEE